MVAGQGAGEAVAHQPNNVWIETSRATFAGVGNGDTTAVTAIVAAPTKRRFETNELRRGIIHGFLLTVNASASSNHKATVRIYESDAGTYNHWSETVDLDSASNIQVRKMIETPSPLFDTPYYTITDVLGGGGKTYTILFYIKTME